MIPVLQLKPADYNPRKITDWELRKLIRSIDAYGFVEPVVVNKDMTIIGGHQRVEAAKSLGWESVPCVVLDLTKGREKSLNLALNRIGGEFDEEKLASLLMELDESERVGSGFDEAEIAKKLGEEMQRQEQASVDSVDDAPLCPTCGQKVKPE